jgi:formiminotetrahydrofolate cyclodeaminase
MLIELSIKEFAARMATKEPPPGGGSVAALSGLMAVGLLEMVLNLSLNQPELAAHSQFLVTQKTELACLHQKMADFVDQDAEAFRDVMKVFHMPKTVGPAELERQSALEAAMRQAAEVPLAMAQACLKVLEIGQSMLGKINAHATGDLMVGVLSGHTGAKGALLCTAMNLPWLKDKTVIASLQDQILLLSKAADKLVKTIQDSVYAEATYAGLQG